MIMSTVKGQTTLPRRPVVLIVDDEVDITETFSMLFELRGFDAITASSGAEALSKLAIQTPDLIVSDCMMPGMDGVEFCNRVRALPQGQSIPIILCSGAPQFHNLTTAAHDAFLRKPFLFETLFAEVKKLLAPK
ncbi:MAG: response regulator [Herbaspirillum sp.]|jgi:CheY-like chemotaxis protein|nr:response regulator [Herbaspirillum sp.]